MSDIYGVKTDGSHACIKIPYKGYEISIALDDSCGAFTYLGRANIKVYRVIDEFEDVSSQFGANEYGTLPADAETLKAIFHKIDMMEKV